MATINLKLFYPELYDRDTYLFIESDTLAQQILKTFETFRKENHAYRERVRAYKAYFSYEDDFSTRIQQHIPSLEEIYETIELKQALNNALNQLPQKQLRRVYAFFFMGYSKSEIARLEGVDKSSIRQSIDRALKQIKRKISEFL